MAVLPIYVIPQPVLKKPADPVAAVTPDIRTLVDDMVDTMYAARGIGLAAPQVGVSKRVIVMDVDQRRADGSEHDESEDDDDEAELIKGSVRVFINPEVVWSSAEENVYEEGCLSVPGQYAPVTRPENVRVKYMDMNGQTQEIEAGGLLATCLQHEIDHLNGILFIDHLSSLKRDMLLRKLKKHLRENPEFFDGTHIL